MNRSIERMCLLILLLLTASIITVSADAYVPLTREQAITWLGHAPFEEVVGFVIKYDEVEHSQPQLKLPEYTALQVGTSLILTPNPAETTLKIGALLYTLQVSPITYSNFFEEAEPKWNWSRFAFPLGLALGVITTSAAALGMSRLVN